MWERLNRNQTSNQRKNQPKEDKMKQQMEEEVEEFRRDFEAGSVRRWEKKTKDKEMKKENRTYR